jgi:hypothetical protein
VAIEAVCFYNYEKRTKYEKGIKYEKEKEIAKHDKKLLKEMDAYIKSLKVGIKNVTKINKSLDEYSKLKQKRK